MNQPIDHFTTAAKLKPAAGISRNWHNAKIRMGCQPTIQPHFFAASLFAVVCAARHTPAIAEEFELITRLCGLALFNAGFVWVGYIVVEPLVRRRWPERIISVSYTHLTLPTNREV